MIIETVLKSTLHALLDLTSNLFTNQKSKAMVFSYFAFTQHDLVKKAWESTSSTGRKE